MSEQELVKFRLQSVKELVDKLMRNIDNDKERITLIDVERLLCHKFPFYYEEEILERLDEVNRKLGERNANCRFSADYDKIIRSNDGAMQLMIAPIDNQKRAIPASRETGLREIRDFTREAKDLIIIDPYIFGGETSKSDDYVNEFKKCTRINNEYLSKIHIIYSAKDGNTKAIKAGIKKLASEHNCSITSCNTSAIHDRIWIKNKSEAIVVGTSFGGLGNRLCFILPLPKLDLQNLLDYLTESNFLTHTYS